MPQPRAGALANGRAVEPPRPVMHRVAQSLLGQRQLRCQYRYCTRARPPACALAPARLPLPRHERPPCRHGRERTMTRRTPPSGSAPPAPLRRLTPQPAAVPARRWRAWQWVVVAAHLAVILGLLATTGGVVLAGRMALRGIETGEDGQPIPYTDVNPLGVNTFLNELANPADVAR
ncbi:MAG: hypothetical protein IRY86_11985, partial [Thermorudis peleae]|nr:hypothetical protein [Thermorudis peleae]